MVFAVSKWRAMAKLGAKRGSRWRWSGPRSAPWSPHEAASLLPLFCLFLFLGTRSLGVFFLLVYLLAYIWVWFFFGFAFICLFPHAVIRLASFHCRCAFCSVYLAPTTSAFACLCCPLQQKEAHPAFLRR